MKNRASLINQTSGEEGFEYYTPPEWTAAARKLMGEIDLDPASNEFANQNVQAKAYYTKDDDGLSKPWVGRVWMNHPFHRGEKPCPPPAKCKKKSCIKRGYHIDKAIPSNKDWIDKLIGEYQSGNLTEAVIITFCNSSETWFRPLLQFPQCFPNGRVHYKKEDGSNADSCTKGSVVTYIGNNLEGFAKVFGRLGTVKVAYGNA